MKAIGPLAAALLLQACSSNTGLDGGTRKDAGGGTDGGGGIAPYSYFTLDPEASELKPLAMAVGPNDRVGVAYFVSVDGGVNATLLDAGATILQNYEVRYAEYKDGVVSTPEVLRTVQLVFGISVAFQASGEPAVAYLGGGSDQSVYWLQSDAVVSYRNGGTWTEQLVVQRGMEAPCPSAALSDRGYLVGLNPALAFDGAKAFLAYRDGHDGQFPQQDWAASDLEIAEGGPTSWTKRCVLGAGDSKLGYGGHISMVVANGQPVAVSDRVLGSADGYGMDVIFTRRKADGTWTSPMTIQATGNNQSGPSLAYDPVEGFGVANLERSSSKLMYSASATGDTWNVPDPVYQSGSGGWWPSLSFDPINHEPAIAFYICSPRNGVNEASCPASEDSLHVRQLIGANWQDQLVDEEGGYLPKLGHFSSGKRVLAYRIPATGLVRLAVER